MAPSVVVPQEEAPAPVAEVQVKKAILTASSQYKEVEPYGTTHKNPRLLDAELHGNDEVAPASYPHFLPVYEHDDEFPPYEDFEHKEIGLDADPSYPELLGEGTTLKYLTPRTGAEVTGVQLSKLSDQGLAQLAHFVAHRGVVVFRDQDLKDQSIPDILKLGAKFGRNHIHPSSGAPKGYPEIHLVHRAGGAVGKASAQKFLEERTSSVAWHSDVTYERQPPGTTFLVVLDAPGDKNGNIAGGDTAFVDQQIAYERLSPEFRKRLRGLKATHSGHEQAEYARLAGGVVRRKPIISEHPLVREHPLTKKKSLFVNEQFTRRITNFKKEESDALLQFLYKHQATGTDFQVRLKWEIGSVVVWDNRRMLHSALLDFYEGERRHLFRITPQAERPYEGEYSDDE